MQVDIDTKKKELVIRLPLNGSKVADLPPSSTGKTLIVAGSGGTKDAGVSLDSLPVRVTASAFVKA